MVRAIKDIFKELRRVREKGSFAQNISIVFSGNAINLLLQLAFAPIISRIYGPEAYGEYAYYNLIVSNIAFFAAISLPSVYVLPKARFDFLALGKLVFFSTVGLSLLSLVLFLALNGWIVTYEGSYLAIPVILVLVLIASINGMLSAWNVREKRFRKETSVGVGSNILAKGGTVGIGYLWMTNGLGLLFGDLIKAVFSFFMQTSLKKRLLVFRFLVKNNWQSVAMAFKKNINVPKYIFPSQLMSKWSADLPILIIGGFYSQQLLGYYIFAVTILNIPKNLITNAIQPVLLQKANELYLENRDAFFFFLKRIYLFVIVMVVIPVTLIAILAPELFNVVFGEEWSESGNIVQLISSQYILSIILTPFVSLRRVLGLEKRVLVLNILSIAFKVLPLTIVFTDIPFDDFLIWYSLSLSVYLFVNFSDLVISTSNRAASMEILLFCLCSLVLSFYLVTYFS